MLKTCFKFVRLSQGLWLDALTKRFGRVVGVDQSPNLLEKAAERSGLFLR